MMQHIVNYSEARQNLKSICDMACNDHMPVFVKRKNGKNVVILSEEEYNCLDETSYLLKSPKNAERLRESLQDVKNNKIAKSFDNIGNLKN